MSEEKVGYRWWVLAMSALIFTIAFGFGWTYIVLVVGDVLADLNLTLVSWGSLWAAISFGTLLTAIVGGVLAPIIGMGLVGINPVLGFAFWGGCYAISKETGPRVRQAE
jgi:hypothetical protein